MKITDKNGRVFEGSADELKGFGFEVELQADGCVYSPDEEVLSEDNVKVGDYFVVMGNRNGHEFTIGEVVKAVLCDDSTSFMAEHLDGSDWWYVEYTDVRRATEEEIAEVIKPKEVLSADDVKVGDYFVITVADDFKVGETVVSVGSEYDDEWSFYARGINDYEQRYVGFDEVRRATAEEIAEATKPKEVKFEVGDVVKVVERFAVVRSEIDLDGDYYIRYIDSGQNRYHHTANIRHATEEEKSHLQTLIGREKYEYKIGDIVELLVGFGSNFSGLEGCFFEIKAVGVKGVTIKRCNTTAEVITEKLAWIIASYLKLVVPVEYRHDFVEKEGVKNGNY